MCKIKSMLTLLYCYRNPSVLDTSDESDSDWGDVHLSSLSLSQPSTHESDADSEMSSTSVSSTQRPQFTALVDKENTENKDVV